MTLADALIVLAIATSVLIGLLRGFVVEAMALLVWALAIGASLWFAQDLTYWLEGTIETTSARIFFAYALIFVGTLLLGAVVTWVLRKFVQGVGLGSADRLLGGAFGVARGLVLIVVVVLMLGLTPFPRDAWWRESQLLPHAVRMAEMARAWLPEPIAAQIRLDGSEAPPLSLLESVST